MENIKQFFVKLNTWFWNLIHRIESSEIFERLVNRYETLTPTAQKRIKIGTTLCLSIFILWFSFSPLLNTRSYISENRNFTALLSRIKSFNTKLESSKKEFVPPAGWQPLQASNLNQLEGSLEGLMASLGFESTQYEIASQGSTLLVHAKEGTIKQLESFLFQVDGAFPKFTIVRHKSNVHPANDELIQFEVEIGAGDFRNLVSQSRPTIDHSQNKSAPQIEEAPPMEDRAPPEITTPDISEPSSPARPSNNEAPGFEPPPPYDPTEDQEDRDTVPSNRDGSAEFEPPMGDEFIPPPPPLPDEEGIYMPEDEFPPEPMEMLE